MLAEPAQCSHAPPHSLTYFGDTMHGSKTLHMHMRMRVAQYAQDSPSRSAPLDTEEAAVACLRLSFRVRALHALRLVTAAAGFDSRGAG